ncbi:MAG: cation:proton antiporter [Acidimicrobiaceae bacterium]|nr:cation:proton antiporter [Acidimicrobiaceae bacterium]MXW74447.1 cation:proton antiporter [Acidimicrobiaceae bacterium]MYD07238.1 cation:proton antiporter [Acidimicrobiaceae bacterium]MYH87830.1 cation:proton antiporter [Acidimicrobiaceae bacterium]MYI59510.1 cation:proton antiporter [Acidimicrobiaceae bacterium]
METEVDILLIEFGTLVLGLALIARAARWLGLPVLPVYLLAGLAFGKGGIVDLGASSDFIEVGAEIGLILMLLTLGLEFSAHELIDNVRKSASAGIVDLVLNFPPGFVAGLLLGFDPIVAVLLGGVTYISSSGIVSKLVADLDRVQNRETPVVLSVLVIEDLAMVLYLPVVTAVLFGDSASTTVITVVISLAAVTAILTVEYFYGDRINSLILSNSREVLLLTLLGATLAIAGLAERIHLSAAVGAFLVGVVLSGEVVSHARDLLLPLRHLFAASFFVFFGLQVDPGIIPDVALLAAALAVLTAVTKVGTGWFAARSKKLDTSERFRAGSALIARGEFSIVIAELGVGREPDLGALSAAYVILLAVTGGLLYHFDNALPRIARRWSRR